MFHDMFVYQSGLGRLRGTKNETLTKIIALSCRWLLPANIRGPAISGPAHMQATAFVPGAPDAGKQAVGNTQASRPTRKILVYAHMITLRQAKATCDSSESTSP